MDAFIYAAALYCADCGTAIRSELQREAGSSHDLMMTGTDSDGYPQGPHSDGGGEADSPQHCARCGTFLENPLTRDGLAYVREAIAEAKRRTPYDPEAPALAIWREHYADELESYMDSEFGADERDGYRPQSRAMVGDVSEFVRAYLVAATDTGIEPPEWHPQADRDRLREYEPEDIHPDSLGPMISAAAELEATIRPTLDRAAADESFTVPGTRGESVDVMAGYFARMEAEGQGVGFWDGRWGDYGDDLSAAVKDWRGGTMDGLYFGDTGGIHGN